MIRYEVWTLMLEAWSQDNLVFRLYTVYYCTLIVLFELYYSLV